MSEYIIRTTNMPENVREALSTWYEIDEEVVRCRDCKRYIPQGTYRFNDGVVNKDTCDVIRGFVVQIEPDGFCAWGERRGE